MTTRAIPRATDLPAVFKAQVLKVVDGNTVHVRLDLRFGVEYRTDARLFGIRVHDGRAARAALQEMVTRCTFKDGSYPYLLVKSHKAADGGWAFELQGLDVHGPFSLNERLVATGQAVSLLP